MIEISSKVFSYVYTEEEHPAGHAVRCGVQHPGLSQHCPCLWDLLNLKGSQQGTVDLPEEPPGSPGEAKHHPANASSASKLTVACKVWAKSSK